MKHIFAAIALFILSLPISAQDEKSDYNLLGSVAFGRDLLAEIRFKTNGADTVYVFYYLDQNYKQQGQYKEISFSNRDFDLFKLYSTLKAAFLPENAPVNHATHFTNALRLGDKEVMVTNLKRHRDMQVIFTTEEGHVLGLTEPQVDKLFGRNGL